MNGVTWSILELMIAAKNLDMKAEDKLGVTENGDVKSLRNARTLFRVKSQLIGMKTRLGCFYVTAILS